MNEHKLLLERAALELELPEHVIILSQSIISKVLLLSKKRVIESVFDLLACVVLSIKLHYGLNDKKYTDSDFNSQIRTMCHKLNRSEQPLWRLQDIN